MKRPVMRALLIFITALFFFMPSFNVFAAITIDGKVSPDEMDDAKVVLLCENGGSGCDVVIFVSYAKPVGGKNAVYLAFALELEGESFTPDGVAGVEIFLSNNRIAKLSSNGEAEYDSSAYDVNYACLINSFHMCCESVIGFKNSIISNPQISVRAVDNDGTPSIMYKLDLTVEQTEESTDAPKPTVTASKNTTEKSTKEKTTKKKQSTTETSAASLKYPASSERKEYSATVSAGYGTSGTLKIPGAANPESTASPEYSGDSAQNAQGVEVYTLPQETERKADASSRRGVLLLCAAVAAVLCIVGAGVGVILHQNRAGGSDNDNESGDE